MNNKIKFSATMLICILLSVNLAWGATDTEKSYDGADLASWSGTHSGQYGDGSLKLDASGEYAQKTNIWSGTVSTNMTSISVTINYKMNGSGSMTSNVFTIAAVNSSGTVKASQTFTPNNTSYGDKTVTLTIPASSAVTGLKITYTTKGNRNVGIASLSATATYTDAVPTYTLKVSDGTGGYTTYNNKVKSDLTEETAMGGNSCTDGLQGAYSGWRTSSLETPAGSPGTTYSHATAGAMPATGSTLYAVYYSYDEGGYLTNTLCEPTCANTVTITQSGHTNGSVSLSSTSVTTCGDAASRQVTVSVTPNTCYAGPTDASVFTITGTAASNASKISGPTWNGSTSKYDYVYQFTQNASGAVNFAVSLSTKTTYTVSYAKGDVPSGGGSIDGSHANDTKTCGDAMDLPAASFTTTGYTQTGWSKTNGGSQYAAVGGSFTDNAAQTFYPVWTANKYTVTWSVNGNTSTISPTTNVDYNTTTTAPTVSTPPCGTFMGWTATENYSNVSSAPGDLFTGTTPAITGNITYYAVFADED